MRVWTFWRTVSCSLQQTRSLITCLRRLFPGLCSPEAWTFFPAGPTSGSQISSWRKSAPGLLQVCSRSAPGLLQVQLFFLCVCVWVCVSYVAAAFCVDPHLLFLVDDLLLMSGQVDSDSS